MIELVTLPEYIDEFIHVLAMCELLSIYNLLEPSMAFSCRNTEMFVEEEFFDSYRQFVVWWDANVVPYINELHEIASKRSE